MPELKPKTEINHSADRDNNQNEKLSEVWQSEITLRPKKREKKKKKKNEKKADFLIIFFTERLTYLSKFHDARLSSFPPGHE